MSPNHQDLSLKKRSKALDFREFRLILTLGLIHHLWAQDSYSEICNDLFILQQGQEVIACLRQISPDSIRFQLSPDSSAPQKTFSRGLFSIILKSNGDTLLPGTQCWPTQCPHIQNAALNVNIEPEDAWIKLDTGMWQHGSQFYDSLAPGAHLIEGFSRAIGKEWFGSKIFYARENRRDTIFMKLKATKTSLNITSNEPDTWIQINQNPPLKLPLNLENVPLDTLAIQAWNKAKGSENFRLPIRPFHPTTLDVKFTSQEPTPFPFGSQSQKIAQGLHLSLVAGALLVGYLGYQDLNDLKELGETLERPSFKGNHWQNRNTTYRQKESNFNDKSLWFLSLSSLSAIGFYPIWKINW